MKVHVDFIGLPRSRQTHATMLQAFALAALGLTSACGDDTGMDDSPDAMPVDEGPLYAIATTQFLPDSTTTLIALVEDPGAPVMVDASRALEVGGAAAIFGTGGRGALAVGSSESPVLTRYEITPDRSFVKGARLTFANTGVSSAFKRQGLVPFLSEIKAYWLDDLTQQVIIWNPDAMTIDGSFSLEAAARDELVFELGERAVVRDDGLLFVGARYRTANEGEAGRAVALIIDTASDELVEVLEDPRCGDTVHVVADQSGTLYFGSGAMAAVLYALQRPADYPAPCMLRILPGERRFDPDFQINISDLVEGRSAGRLVAGKDGRAYVLALHEEYLDAEARGGDRDLGGVGCNRVALVALRAWLGCGRHVRKQRSARQRSR